MSDKIKVTLEEFVGAMVALANEDPDKRYISPGGTEPVKWGDGCFNFHPPLGWKRGYAITSEEMADEDNEGSEFHPSRSEWTPGCIVGSAYVKVTGLSASALMMRGVSNEGGVGTSLLQMESIWEFPSPEEHQLAEDFAGRAQEKQDHGETWGESVRAAAERIKSLVDIHSDTYEHMVERVNALTEPILSA